MINKHKFEFADRFFLQVFIYFKEYKLRYKIFGKLTLPPLLVVSKSGKTFRVKNISHTTQP